MRDEVVVITGVAGGIGAAIATELRDSGWSVIGIDHRDPGWDVDDRSTSVIGDVADAETHERAVAAAAELGRLVGWVNNAGVTESTPLHAISDEVLDRTLRSNLYGALSGTRAAIQTFLRHRVAGAIVNVSSIHARGAFPGTPAYDSSKAGIEALTRYAAAEYGHLGIRVNAVAPGAIRTEMVAKAIAEASDPERLERDFAELHPLARLGEPREVARAVRFLLSSDASFISGAVLPVDGAAAARVFGFAPHVDVPTWTSEPKYPEDTR